MGKKNKYMTLKHINIVLKIINHLHIKQNKTFIIFKYKKEYLPILFFLKSQKIIYKYSLFNKKYIKFFFKSLHNVNFLKHLKIYDYKSVNYKKINFLMILKDFNKFKLYVLFSKNGLLSLEESLEKNTGGFLISRIN